MVLFTRMAYIPCLQMYRTAQTLYGCENWSNMTESDVLIMEIAHRFVSNLCKDYIDERGLTKLLA